MDFPQVQNSFPKLKGFQKKTALLEFPESPFPQCPTPSMTFIPHPVALCFHSFTMSSSPVIPLGRPRRSCCSQAHVPVIAENEESGTQRGLRFQWHQVMPQLKGEQVLSDRQKGVTCPPTGRISRSKLLFQNMHSLYLKHIYVEEESGMGDCSS